MNSVTIRLISNGYIVSSFGPFPAPTLPGQQETFCPTLDAVKAYLDSTFEPAPQ